MDSAYRLMWMIVMFDLPVLTPRERKIATTFRNFLLDEGFTMSQYSVYLRFCGTREKAEAFSGNVRRKSPEIGDVSILFFTDRQFSEIINITNRRVKNNPEKPDQLLLF